MKALSSLPKQRTPVLAVGWCAVPFGGTEVTPPLVPGCEGLVCRRKSTGGPLSMPPCMEMRAAPQACVPAVQSPGISKLASSFHTAPTEDLENVSGPCHGWVGQDHIRIRQVSPGVGGGPIPALWNACFLQGRGASCWAAENDGEWKRDFRDRR